MSVQGVTIFLESKNIENTANFYTKVFEFHDYKSFNDEVIRLNISYYTIIIQKTEIPNKTSFGLDIKDTTSLMQRIEDYGNIKFKESNPYDSAHGEFVIYDVDGNDITLVNYNYK